MPPQSISSYWVQKELDAAFSKKVEIIPIVIKYCKTPPLLSRSKVVDFTTDYHQALFELLKRIKATVQSNNKKSRFLYKEPVDLHIEDNTIPCYYCDGEGGEDDLDGHWIECEYCNGTGKIDEPDDD